MAGRGDLIVKWEEERRQSELVRSEAEHLTENVERSETETAISDLDKLLGVAGPLPEIEIYVQSTAVPLAESHWETLRHARPSEDEVAGQFQQRKKEAIAAAMEEIQRKEAKPVNRWFQAAGKKFDVYRQLRASVTWCLAFAAASFTAYRIHEWSSTQSLRFPTLFPKPWEMRPFPLVGSCSTMEYAFFLGETAIMAGIVGYFLSRYLVNLADE